MSSKGYSKHKEFNEFHSSSKSSGNFNDEQFNKLKSELIPRTRANLDSIGQNGGHKEYHYEYKEEKHPTGKYDRKDLRTVEEYSVPPKSPTPKKSESNHYYYEKEERDFAPINTSYNNAATKSYNYEHSSTSPGYAKITSSKATRDLAHNVDELDTLLDDLQKDQERKTFKSSGYTSDTNESSSYDYRKLSPAKSPSSGYSSLRKEERVEASSWSSPPPPPAITRSAELRQEERVETSSWSSPPPPPAITRSAEMRQEMYREEKTESRVIPSQISPAIAHPVPAPVCINCQQATTGTLSRASTPMNKVTTTVKTYTYEVPADQDPIAVPLPTVPDHERTYYSSTEHLTSSSTQHRPPPPTISQHYHHSATSEDRTSERVLYPKPVNEVRVVPHEPPLNGHGPYGPTSYKYSETTYSAENTTERYPAVVPRPAPPVQEQLPPKRLDDLMADFPEARFPTQPDGMYHRKVEMLQESSHTESRGSAPISKNVAGPPVYYPPGHTPFEKKEVASYQASAMQSGGGHASGKAMYEYESGSKSKSKTTEKKTAVPVCLPLCCAMPCVIM